MVDRPNERVALITGGARGIGFATAKAFLQSGFKVALVSQHVQKLAKARAELEPMGILDARAFDVRSAARMAAFVEQIRERFGRIDILVNNAGRAWSGRFVDQPLTSIEAIVDVNLKGLLYASHAVLPVMLAQQSGVIVNVASGAGLHGFGGLAVYCASKFAVVGFTESLAAEVLSAGIRVFAVCPGRVATDMQVEVSGQRIGISADRVAGMIFELARQGSADHIGRCLTVA